MRAVVKGLLGIASVVCIGAAIGLQTTTSVTAENSNENLSAVVTEVNNEGLDNGNSFVMILSNHDYMTAKEWDDSDYKWLNVEEFVGDRTTFEKANVNVCNAPLDQNLDKYNFEKYVYIDGVTLAEFSQTHAYKLIASKRQRLGSLSIDFEAGVLSQIDVIEIKEGCQFPTLAYSYFGTGEFACIEMQETAAFERRGEGWYKYFEGYQAGVEYEGSKDNLKTSLEKEYKGYTAVALDAYTDFFMHNAVQGEYLSVKALVSGANTEKDNLMVLRFVNPIDATQFNRLNLRVYINHQIDVLTYNADAITEDSLGAALEKYTVGGGQFTYLQLNSALYTDENNEVSEIIFKFVDDCQPQYSADGKEILYDGNGNIIRDTFFFVSFNVENVVSESVVGEDSFMVVDDGDSYELTFRFHNFGAMDNMTLDTSKVTLNGYTLDDVLAECKDATAEWYPAKGVYQINVSLPKAYTGKAQIKNVDYNFAGNNMSVLEGLTFPNGNVLDRTYTCHLYAGENLLDSELVSEYAPLEVERVTFAFIDDNNLNFSIYFNGPITSSLYNHACEKEAWRASEDVREIISYDQGSAEIFINGGYKASLLDNVVINGLTIGEWHASAPANLTNVQVHYGVGLQLNRMDVRFEAATKDTYDKLYEYAAAGNGITVEVLSGLKFMTARKTVATQTFVMNEGVFAELRNSAYIHVYFDGSEIVNGQEITVQTAVSDSCIAVTGVQDYEITHTVQDGKRVYTITYDEGKTFTFTVVEDLVKAPKEKEDGCSSYLGAGFAIVSLAVCAVLTLAVKGGRKHEEK